ncbi:DUF2973 domain-containing protein [Synechococcales cyanobacterium C]|uniref:DUF2973 domain-containing protein n=1 Tax=Petrachloros mirabilis ULC683 TaxID=2781853 RepID=A0A8K2A900_9CYAN|nr:DUF2973 domain-containing protein [Petrachloros mirabilis]NCJ08584.1 DUF2973 domain-containing protein [Petrachloros mirabilis ULC683]
MLQLLYILAFTILAFLAIGNLIRNLITIGRDSHKLHSRPQDSITSRARMHPELLDDTGRIIDEPLLVMRSMTMEDAREQLDSLYNQSPGGSDE